MSEVREGSESESEVRGVSENVKGVRVRVRGGSESVRRE